MPTDAAEPRTVFTHCLICEQLCGLEVAVTGGRMQSIRPDPPDGNGRRRDPPDRRGNARNKLVSDRDIDPLSAAPRLNGTLVGILRVADPTQRGDVAATISQGKSSASASGGELSPRRDYA